MDYHDSTNEYLDWLRSFIPLDDDQLDTKNKRMKISAFCCLRGTFYRWAQHWQSLDVPADAPVVLGVGDLHIENFGTWRDREGRLAWGVNDFDEACELPYLSDLVRLATSAHLAFLDYGSKVDSVKCAKHLTIDAICQAICSGYRKGLLDPQGFIIGEQHQWMLEITRNRVHAQHDKGHSKTGKAGKTSFEEFARKMQNLKPPMLPEAPGLQDAETILKNALLEYSRTFRIGSRIAGLGSLGRQRYTGVIDNWNGGMVVREVKRLAPSAWHWATGDDNGDYIYYQEIADGAKRSSDPTLSVFDQWVVRRLAADANKIELDPRAPELSQRLLEAMGYETANIHQAAIASVSDVRDHLDACKRTWMPNAVLKMTQFTQRDHSAIVKSRKKSSP